MTKYISAEDVEKLNTSEITWTPEDELPEMSDRIFNMLFRYSKVDFIRLYPTIYLNGEAHYVI